MISIQNLSHRYADGTNALSNINVDIGTGMVGLLGGNGAGKSTLMRVICTLLEPSEGSVSVEDCDVVQQRTAVRQRLGYLPQDFGAWRSQRVEHVLDALASLSGMRGRAKRRQRIGEVLDMVGLTGVASRRIHKLSGGMLRRVGVAQALLHDPRVLIMDEPSVGLDPEERLRFRQLISELAADRLVLLSTHIVSDLGPNCSELMVMDRGQLKFFGRPDEFIELASGCVFEVAVEASGGATASQMADFEVVSSQNRDGKTFLRGVAPSAPAGVVCSEVDDATLEEAYMAFSMTQPASSAVRH